jgi:dipeptidyl aminopeptidase/acylaminoacyl peptidase
VTPTLRALLKAPRAALVDVGVFDGSDRLLVLSDLAGTKQLYELAADASLRVVTDLTEPVGAAAYVPGQRRAVIGVDRGGDELHQLYLVDLDGGAKGTGQLEALTDDPRYAHELAGVSPDGGTVAYLSNRRNGVDFDLWACDLATRSHRSLYSEGGWCQPSSGFSPDGRWVAMSRPGPRPLDDDLVLVEVATGEARTVLPHPDEAAEVGPPLWWDNTTFFVSSNVSRDRATIVRYDLSSGEESHLAGGDWDMAPVTGISGGPLVAVENRNGSSRMFLLDPTVALEERGLPLAEPGVVLSSKVPGPRLSPDGTRLYYTLTSPRLAGDIWVYDLLGDATHRLTSSPMEVPSEDLFAPEAVEVESFDGERVPAFVYRPTATPTHPPVVVMVHGGPESQSVLAFDPVVQGLVAEGFAVVVPNVRGSTGYGKRFSALDDTTLRMSSVRDLAALHDWLPSVGLDPDRAALYGASYGGYMVLAGLAFQPERWAAGVDIVGISDLVTFLENTSAYRRAHREHEYGSLIKDRDFLVSASPLRHADAICAPLFVVHGRNDPRVPVGQTEQMVARLRERKVPCELVIYEDEGHGLARLANRLDALPRAIEFLAKVLKPDAKG